MNIKRKFTFALLAIGMAASAIGCSVAPPAHASSTPVVSVSATPEATSSASPEVSATAAVSTPAAEKKVDTVVVAAPVAESPAVEPVAAIPAPVEAAPAPDPVMAVPVEATPAQPVPAAPQPAPAPVQAAPAPVAAAPAVAAPAVSREIYVGLAGGQAVVDQQRGPVLFPLPAGYPPYVAEHDLAGGWARFGTLSPGMTVRMSGLVTGTYTVGQIINVPKGGSTSELRQFGTMPKVMLQTCVPGTSRMIVVGLY